MRFVDRLLGRPVPVPQIEGTHVLRIHDGLLEALAERNNPSIKATIKWSDPDEWGISEATMYRHDL